MAKDIQPTVDVLGTIVTSAYHPATLNIGVANYDLENFKGKDFEIKIKKDGVFRMDITHFDNSLTVSNGRAMNNKKFKVRETKDFYIIRGKGRFKGNKRYWVSLNVYLTVSDAYRSQYSNYTLSATITSGSDTSTDSDGLALTF